MSTPPQPSRPAPSRPGQSPRKAPARVAVVGAGRMGSGIAHAFLLAGSTVQIVESDAGAAERGRSAVAKALQASVDRGKLDGPVEHTQRRLEVRTDIAALGQVELAVEAVPEDPALKADVLARLAAAAGPEAVLASNTSSLSIDELAAAVPAPDRLLGLHFFNPVPASTLVEVVAGTATDPAVVTAAQQWVTALGKTAVTVRDSPGFASSRLGVLLGLEAIRMLEAGVASAEDIDAAMTLGYGHPMGPLRLTDLVGLDVRLGIAEYLAGKLGERFTPPQLLRDKVSRGELGRKSGRGFFEWEDQA
ncbi:3-hydroxyacyl-CoA dehydrogenase family protein [Nakamurella aerolata]|uniref:3-hydroxyacyl-CoA dehydrogenase family protein n=1 Tax=Nakamurella aerolata TaxID=1656892 RepID=A0A849ABQ0_9ACTN|nr:3-hydroxyacyl-CoA dehydrogenase family protein [Nakamurella aerolata]NNG37113.1 3-hydroxyacyl-CoA dehydrogenase family protein [Nakamurella aerolata]